MSIWFRFKIEICTCISSVLGIGWFSLWFATAREMKIESSFKTERDSVVPIYHQHILMVDHEPLKIEMISFIPSKRALSAFISFLFLHFYESTLQCSQCVAESVTKTKPTWERNNKWQSQEKNKQSKKISNFFNCKQSKWSMLQPRISSFSFFLRKRNKRKEIERAAHK